MSAGANPVKPEEAKIFLEVARELKEKDPKDVDMEKLEHAMELAWRIFEEEGRYEAARLWMALYILRGILRKERGEF